MNYMKLNRILDVEHEYLLIYQHKFDQLLLETNILHLVNLKYPFATNRKH